LIQAGDSVLETLSTQKVRQSMSGIVYMVGLVVIVIAVLSFFGLR
jgi:hypothetical protein